jgi:hypothetical protein
MLKGISRPCQITHRSAVLNLSTLRLLGKHANAYAYFTAPPVTNPRKTDCRPLVRPFGTNKRDAAYYGVDPVQPDAICRRDATSADEKTATKARARAACSGGVMFAVVTLNVHF